MLFSVLALHIEISELEMISTAMPGPLVTPFRVEPSVSMASSDHLGAPNEDVGFGIDSQADASPWA